MKIAILGFDVEGQASYEYFSGRGDEIVICDRDETKVVPEGVEARLGDDYLDGLGGFDLLVRTPGLKPSLILDQNPGVADKITSGTNEFFRQSPSSNIIGVTGSKGKGTTSTLIARMLEAAGKTVHLGGNIGVPALSLLPNIQPDDWIVLELSSYQLADLSYSPHIAVCLMVVPEHLDWHGTTDDYYTAKEQLFARQTPGDIAIYYHDNDTSRRIANASQGRKIPYYHVEGAEVTDGTVVIASTPVCRTDELKLLGQHNWQNVCAAVTAVTCALTGDTGQPDGRLVEAMRSVLTSFSGLPFRIEFRREVGGVRYYNDSFSSAPPATVAALAAIPGPSVLIIGGYDRNLGLDELVKGVVEHAGDIRHLLVIGAARERIASTLAGAGFEAFTVSDAQDMPSVVRQAAALAEAGDAVILSPGFPSFDMFRNFQDRGEQFNQAVDAL